MGNDPPSVGPGVRAGQVRPELVRTGQVNVPDGGAEDATFQNLVYQPGLRDGSLTLVRGGPDDERPDIGTRFQQLGVPGSNLYRRQLPRVAQAPGVAPTGDRLTLAQLFKPDVWALGAATGRDVPEAYRGGIWALLPAGGGPPIIFASRPVTFGRFGGPAPQGIPFGRGGVITYNTGTGSWEVGYGGALGLNVLSIPVTVWGNARLGELPEGFIDPATGDVSANFTGDVSINVGIAVSADQLLARGLAGGSMVAGAIPTPITEAAAGIMATGSGALTVTGRFGNAYAGAGYRMTAHWENGQFQGLYYHGQKIDLQQFAEDTVRAILPDNTEREHDLSTALRMNASVAHEFATYFRTSEDARNFLQQTADYINSTNPNTRRTPITVPDLVRWFNDTLPEGQLHLFVERQIGEIRPDANGRFSTVLSSAVHGPGVLRVAQSIPDMLEAAQRIGFPVTGSRRFR
jgi:hypothetical protein